MRSLSKWPVATKQPKPRSKTGKEEQSSIAERVRFWEEQDKINQELIPRVIRQNELLTKHIAEHDSLPEVAGKAISQALAGAREEQRSSTRQPWTSPRESFRSRPRPPLDQTLATVRQDMQQQYDAALDQAVATLQQESRKMRNVFIGIASGAVVACVAALIVGLLA